MIGDALSIVGTSVVSAITTYNEFYASLPGAMQVAGAAVAVCVIVRYLLRPIVGDQISAGRSDFVKKRKASGRRGSGK